jgi:hypothetical protein
VNALRVMVYLERELETPIDFEHFMKARSLGDLWGASAPQPVAP